MSAAGIPTIALVFGSSTAGGAYLPGMSDYVVMVAGPGQGVPGRAAAGQDGHRRGVRRRVARRRRHARAPVRAGRLPRRRRARRAADRPVDRGQAQLARPRSPGRPGTAAPRAALQRGRAARHRARGPEGAVRPARGHRPDRRRLGLRRVQAAVREQPGDRLGRAARVPGRHPGQRARRAVQRGIAEGRPVHPAGQPGRRAAAVPAEHHRLHGRQPLRAGRDHQARGA